MRAEVEWHAVRAALLVKSIHCAPVTLPGTELDVATQELSYCRPLIGRRGAWEKTEQGS
jgi:hypothetical protein